MKGFIGFALDGDGELMRVIFINICGVVERGVSSQWLSRRTPHDLVVWRAPPASVQPTVE